MVDSTGQARTSPWKLLVPGRTRQLELPLEGLPSTRRIELQRGLKDFATGFAPRVGSRLLMRVGVPMVAATTPVAIGMFAPDRRDDVWFNLAVGSGLGGAWGAGVGALLPYGGAGERIGRLRSVGRGAASGVVMAPAIAVVSKYVADWLTNPIRAEDAASDAATRD